MQEPLKQKFKLLSRVVLTLLLGVVLIGLPVSGYFAYQKLDSRLAGVEQQFSQIESLQKQIDQLAEGYAALQERPTEVVRREVIRQKSQDELLTEAVAKVAPAVVSIVVTKDVPRLEVVYVNPFGDDPFFKDFGFRIPVYRQKGTEEKEVGAGTGFLIRPDGVIVTNRHVVDDPQARFTVLLSDGSQKPARVLYRDPNIDIAFLKIDGSGYQYAELGDSDSLKLGQSVFAIGNALGEYNNSVSVGIISGLNRNIQASNGVYTEKLQGVIQTDAAINPGNSGGPLTDLAGKVIGVNVATVQGSENIGFAIPINVVKSIINKVLGAS